MDTLQSSVNKKTGNCSKQYPVYSTEQALEHLTKPRPASGQRLYVYIDEILFNKWDALCLSINQDYRDEYLPYLPYIFDLLKVTKDGHEIFDYLLFIEEEKIGTFPGDTLVARRATSIVEALLDFRASILKRLTKT